MPRPTRARLLAFAVSTLLLLVSWAWAHDVDVRVTLETPPGEPVPVEGLAAGDVAVLEVTLLNRGDVPIEVDDLWLVVPPVEGATRFGNNEGGFSFPDRMRAPDGTEVPVRRNAAPEITHLHALSEPLAPGTMAELPIRLTILSSRNTVADLMEAVHLEDGDGERVGRRVEGF